MAVTIKASGPRGAKTYEVRIDGALYDYTDSLAAARRAAAQARKEQRSKGVRKNPGTKAQRAVASQKAAAKRRVAVALAKYLKQQNPAAGKLAGAKIEKLKGGVLKITPIRANAARDVIARAASKVGRAVRGRPFTLGRRRKN